MTFLDHHVVTLYASWTPRRQMAGLMRPLRWLSVDVLDHIRGFHRNLGSTGDRRKRNLNNGLGQPVVTRSAAIIRGAAEIVGLSEDR